MGKPEFPKEDLFYGAKYQEQYTHNDKIIEQYAEARVAHALAEEAKKNCGNCDNSAFNFPRAICGKHDFVVAWHGIKCNDWKEKA